MTRGRHARRRSAVALAVAVLLPAAAGCVTTYEDAPLPGGPAKPLPYAVPVAIPIGAGSGGDRRQLAAYARSVLQGLEDAARDRSGRDPTGAFGERAARLEELLARYDGKSLPSELAGPVGGYRLVARGLRFLQHVVGRAELSVSSGDGGATAAGAPALGAPLAFELRLPAPSAPVVLGGREDADPLAFVVVVAVEDAFVDGSTRSSRTQEFAWLPAALELGGDTMLRLPVAVELPGGSAVRREVHVHVDLMPGYVRQEGDRLPIERATIAARTVTQFPAGYDAVAAAPLAELQAALRTFAPRDFPRAWLAALATRGADREQAIELLVQQVRFGRADQAQVAMAALRVVTGVLVPVGDRDGWLAWWQQRR